MAVLTSTDLQMLRKDISADIPAFGLSKAQANAVFQAIEDTFSGAALPVYTDYANSLAGDAHPTKGKLKVNRGQLC